MMLVEVVGAKSMPNAFTHPALYVLHPFRITRRYGCLLPHEYLPNFERCFLFCSSASTSPSAILDLFAFPCIAPVSPWPNQKKFPAFMSAKASIRVCLSAGVSYRNAQQWKALR